MRIIDLILGLAFVLLANRGLNNPLFVEKITGIIYLCIAAFLIQRWMEVLLTNK